MTTRSTFCSQQMFGEAWPKEPSATGDQDFGHQVFLKGSKAWASGPNQVGIRAMVTASQRLCDVPEGGIIGYRSTYLGVLHGERDIVGTDDQDSVLHHVLHEQGLDLVGGGPWHGPGS